MVESTVDPKAPARTKRDLVSIEDLSNSEIEGLFDAADKFSNDLKAWSQLCPGFILGSLFHEPSTRTRLSFESSMLRLGGGVISVADAKSSSAVKGETLADTIRIMGGSYADIIVLRHGKDGAARHAANYSPIPVINAGDGAHEHPTQTLCDLYSLRKAKGTLTGQDVVLCGDLKHSRTVHSLAFALARFKANIVCVPHPGLEMPSYVTRRLRDEFRCEPHRATLDAFRKLGSELDAVYFTPESPHQLSWVPLQGPVDLKKVDALYLTRPQTERFASGTEKEKTGYFRVDREFLTSEPLRNAMIMHPLPRTQELAPELDADPRSLYFQQAALGVPIRMAVVASLLGKLPWKGKPQSEKSGPRTAHGDGIRCENSNCISLAEKDYAHPRFRVTAGEELRARCEYCDHESLVTAFGFAQSRKFRRYEASSKSLVAGEDLVLFDNEKDAQAQGYQLLA